MSQQLIINQEVFAQTLPIADDINAFARSRRLDAGDEYLACLLCAIGIARANALTVQQIQKDLGRMHDQLVQAEVESRVIGVIDKSELN